MTAVDAAVQSRKLGAEEVTIVYRRGQAQMPASAHEQALGPEQRRADPAPSACSEAARRDDSGQHATFASVRDRGGRLVETETWVAEADMVLKAIGRTLDAGPASGIALEGGRIPRRCPRPHPRAPACGPAGTARSAAATSRSRASNTADRRPFDRRRALRRAAARRRAHLQPPARGVA